ncbi:fumarylacetoacetate hydrolase family protein [Kaistia dalseonensis]|uniref:Fumarylpyruvate hydrolase n=1 Tax=Kaistia dalseonensis TaxID=410840 RepID=A0ABU0HCR6_9HYPH|nr:fumarylacetoacetate hydrolase family protein [Kaistia dalseonensis]MCX5496915.1 fumarylacetoacetate hydrolase family protein [Kaistia dalseonensis]MDQ0439540.1 fumarylpyruvate hydrolase [Kaistia dalseonensis]
MSEPHYAIPPAPISSLPIQGSEARFPIHRIYCVGRNYAAHAREMGHDPDREPPFFFLKNPDDIVEPGVPVPYPPLTEDLHHEVELVVALGEGGSDIPAEAALDHVFGYAIGLDLTRRDVQAEAKKLARPWATSKAFAASAPTGPIHTAAAIGHPDSGLLTATVNGAVRQEGDLADMIWSVPEIIAHLSRWFVLAPGDLIFTGTPAGVGGLVRGDIVVASIAGLGELSVPIV